MARILDPKSATAKDRYNLDEMYTETLGMPSLPDIPANTPFNPWGTISSSGQLMNMREPGGTAGTANYLENMRPPTQQDVSQVNAAGGGLAAGGGGGQGFGFSPWTVGPDGKKYFADLAANQADFRKVQQGIIDQNQNSLDGYKAIPQQLDLSPLAALADKWTQGGGSAMQGYNKPAPIDQRVQMIQALQKGVQDANLGLSKGDLAYLKEYGDTKDRSDMMTLQGKIANAKLMEAQAMKTGQDNFKLSKEANDAKEKYQAKFGENIRGLAQISKGVNVIKDILGRHGNALPPAGSQDYLDYRAATSSLLTNINRDYAKLGALAGSDKTLLEMQAAAKTGMLESYIDQMIQGGDMSGTLAVLDRLEKNADSMVESAGRSANATWKVGDKSLVSDVYEVDKDTYYSTKPKQMSEELKPGTEKQGYVFLGGDQYDEKNWRAK